MNISGLKSKLLEGGFDSELIKLYGDAEGTKARYIEALESFERLYPDSANIRIFSAPGRTEISGNHTDHQHGCVLAGSVQLDVIAIVAENDSNIISITSKGYPTDVLDITDLEKKSEEEGRSVALIKGTCKGFKDLGVQLKGFNAYTISEVPAGSGLSSSAAFEVLLGTILNGLTEAEIDPITVAKIGQYAEREYFGKPCGLLDQMASASGGFVYADFNNPKNPIVKNIQLDIDALGYTLCVVNTGGNHADLTDDYAAVTRECKAISNELGVDFLRDADTDKFFANIPALREKCGDRAVLRAFHFFNEQQRVEEQRAALVGGDIDTFLSLVNASGQSSYDYLQNLYSPSNLKEQGLPLGIALTKDFLSGKGACRVHGGGFAGTIQCYIPSDMFCDYKAMIEAVFGKESCTKLHIRSVGGYEMK